MSLQTGSVGRDRFLIPFKTNAGHVGDVEQSATHFVGLLQNGVGPVLPFQPMRGLGDAHHVRGHLGVTAHTGEGDHAVRRMETT
jgi:hypothetical protein